MKGLSVRNNNRTNLIGNVSVTYKRSTGDEEVIFCEDYIMAKDDVQKIKNPAQVGASMGLTLNMGNYESARVDAWLQMPCDPAKIDDAYSDVTGWVEKKVGEQRDAIRQIQANG